MCGDVVGSVHQIAGLRHDLTVDGEECAERMIPRGSSLNSECKCASEECVGSGIGHGFDDSDAPRTVVP